MLQFYFGLRFTYNKTLNGIKTKKELMEYLDIVGSLINNIDKNVEVKVKQVLEDKTGLELTLQYLSQAVLPGDLVRTKYFISKAKESYKITLNNVEMLNDEDIQKLELNRIYEFQDQIRSKNNVETLLRGKKYEPGKISN